jgi:hypothetical protein
MQYHAYQEVFEEIKEVINQNQYIEANIQKLKNKRLSEKYHTQDQQLSNTNSTKIRKGRSFLFH